MASTRDQPPHKTTTSDNTRTHVNGYSMAQHNLSNNLFANLQAAAAASTWVEPPLRPPQPSFMDNKLERQGVLENMMPLGTSPSSLKLKPGRADPLRRQMMQSRTLDAAAATAAAAAALDETRSTPERSYVSEGTRAASLRAEGSSRPVTPPTPQTNALATPVNTSPARQDATVVSPHVSATSVTSSFQPQQQQHQQQQQQAAAAHARVSTPSVSQIMPPPPGSNYFTLTQQLEALQHPSASIALQQFAQTLTSKPASGARLFRTPSMSMAPNIEANFNMALFKTRDRAEISDALISLRTAMRWDKELEEFITWESHQTNTPQFKRLLKKKIRRIKQGFKRRNAQANEAQAAANANVVATATANATASLAAAGNSAAQEAAAALAAAAAAAAAAASNAFGPSIARQSQGIAGVNMNNREPSIHSNNVPFTLPATSTHQPHMLSLQTPRSSQHLASSNAASPPVAATPQPSVPASTNTSTAAPAAAANFQTVTADTSPHNLDPALVDTQSRHSSSSSLSEIESDNMARKAKSSAQTVTAHVNANGKRSLEDVDPDMEETKRQVRSRLVGSDDVLVNESSVRDHQTGTLSPSAPVNKGPTLRLFSTRSRSSLASPAAAAATATAVAAPTPALAAAASPAVGLVTDDDTAMQDGGAAAASPVTPGPTNLGRPPKRRPAPTPSTAPTPTITTATAPRVKMSPQKKGRNTVVAGIGRLDGKRPETPDHDGQANMDSQSENNDFCSACSGNGFLLCCDGCERSFHFDCADPPIDPEHHLEEPWFCQLCAGRRNGHGQNDAAMANPSGLFSRLEAQLQTRNTTAFVLPRHISTFFEGVRMGADGEYQLATQTMPKNWKRKTGYNEDGSRNNLLVQLYSDKAETRPILCSACGLSSSGGREIVPCDICPLAWHTDCMNPPMANAPRQKTPWHCPAHATHAISSLDPLRHKKIQDEGIPPSHRVRRPRQTKVVDPPSRRTFLNNGLIEIQDDSGNLSEDDTWIKDDQNQLGTVYKLPASGIITDFISKAKADQVIEQELLDKEHKRVERIRADLRARSQYQLHRQVHKRNLVERKIALSLVQLKHGQDAFRDLSSDGILNLTYSLEAEAPDEIINDAKYARTSRDSSVASERKQLEMMQALIKQRLDRLGR